MMRERERESPPDIMTCPGIMFRPLLSQGKGKKDFFAHREVINIKGKISRKKKSRNILKDPFVVE